MFTKRIVVLVECELKWIRDVHELLSHKNGFRVCAVDTQRESEDLEKKDGVRWHSVALEAYIREKVPAVPYVHPSQR